MANLHKSNQNTLQASSGFISGLGLRSKLFIGFGIILAILVVSITTVLIKVTDADLSAQYTIQVDLPTYDAYLDLHTNLYQSLAELHGWVLLRNPERKTDFESTWINIAKSENNLDQYAKNWPETARNDWLTVKTLLDQIKVAEFKALNSPPESIEAIKQTFITEIRPIFSKIINNLDGLKTTTGERQGGIFTTQLEKLTAGTNKIIENLNSIRSYEYLLLFIGSILSLIIAVITTNIIVEPLKKAISIAKEIANGNRNTEIVITSNDETGQLLSALDVMQTAINDNDDKLKANEAHTRKLFDNIVQTANAFSSHSSKVAGGDLTQRITMNAGDEMGSLGEDLNTMTESLANMTKQITSACHNMVTTLDEVKNAVDTQSSGAAEQASSINQITASLEEIEKSSMQTIEKAKMLGDVAERTRAKGELGLNAVEQSVNGMKIVREKVQTIAQTILDLSNQTQQVGEITAVVNTLAQQSKMLALNASIEAAKAGEAGKGFAVVAAEVKNLAEQSEQSTAQVQKILEDIRHATEKAVMATEEGTKGVDKGTELVEQTGEVVRSLSDVIHEATIASQQIEAAIRQEGIGIEQITAGMNEINQVTSSSVASVKQTTEAIGNLSTIAKSLKEQIDIYKI